MHRGGRGQVQVHGVVSLTNQRAATHETAGGASEACRGWPGADRGRAGGVQGCPSRQMRTWTAIAVRFADLLSCQLLHHACAWQSDFMSFCHASLQPLRALPLARISRTSLRGLIARSASGTSPAPVLSAAGLRPLQTSAGDPVSIVPPRKQLKDEVKRRKQALRSRVESEHRVQGRPDTGWELTVGIEIHAELDTASKLFSPAATSSFDDPNSHVALFDAAFPGAQPQLQSAVLLPALRAALALNCTIQHKSSFDRKHYFYQDQPAGYQITQFYEPFATSGSLTLTRDDGIDEADYPHITVPIKQIQLEQDTAKTIHQPPSTYLIDFNRVSHPLIEIISMPAIHSPATAAAYVRKVQSILSAVGAATTGMELGGLRADVNVSVKRAGTKADSGYYGYEGLGTRTEIKNLSSFKSVAEAVALERDRQIAVLEGGGQISSETRGYVVGGTQTTKLRSKEGEVDYRYMPDPDIAPLLIHNDLVAHLRGTLPKLPDEVVATLVDDHGLTTKDAKTLREADDGERLEYFFEVLDLFSARAAPGLKQDSRKLGKAVADWAIHELGALLTASEASFSPLAPHPQEVADILRCLLAKEITVDTARALFARCYRHAAAATSTAASPSAPQDIASIIDRENLRLQALPDSVYEDIAAELIAENPDMVRAIREKGQRGKLMWFVGQMMRSRGPAQAKLEAKKAELILNRMLGV